MLANDINLGLGIGPGLELGIKKCPKMGNRLTVDEVIAKSSTPRFFPRHSVDLTAGVRTQNTVAVVLGCNRSIESAQRLNDLRDEKTKLQRQRQ